METIGMPGGYKAGHDLIFLLPALATYACLARLYPILAQDILHYRFYGLGFVVLLLASATPSGTGATLATL